MTNSKDSVILPSWWNAFPWILASVVLGAGFTTWFENMSFTLNIVSLYQIFPILGIWAWSIMWTHFIIGEIRRLNPKLPKHMPYHRVSSAAVLALIVLHPIILAIEQFRQGKGFPPFSYFTYAGEASIWLILLGIVGLICFLFYEVMIRFEKNKKVKKVWWLVNITQTIAMVSIFTHGLELGGDLHGGWFRTYWVWLGLLLIPCLLHTHWTDLKKLGDKIKKV